MNRNQLSRLCAPQTHGGWRPTLASLRRASSFSRRVFCSALLLNTRSFFSACPVRLVTTRHARARAAAGLWITHSTSLPAIPTTNTNTAAPIPQSEDATRVQLKEKVAPSTQCVSLRKQHKASAPTPRSPLPSPPHAPAPLDEEAHLHFTLNAPFTPVPGEKSVTNVNAAARCLYVCGGCRSPVFSSDALEPGSRIGVHQSGWPTFTHPLAAAALRCRTALQRSVVARANTSSASADAADTARQESASGGSLAASRGVTTPMPPALTIHVPDASVVQRGLAVEGDIVRRRGEPIRSVTTRSWRETCLRDTNHRADPALVLGCCGTCGRALCRVTQSARHGTRYVSTASCIHAVSPKS